MDGEREGIGVETTFFGSAVGRPAVVAEILETFLDTLALRVAKGCSAPPEFVGRATPAVSKSTDFFCWASPLLELQDSNFLKETLRYIVTFFLSFSAIVDALDFTDQRKVCGPFQPTT